MRRMLWPAALILPIQVVSLTGQVREASDTGLHTICVAAAQALGTSGPGPAEVQAAEVLEACGQSGPPSLAHFWKGNPGYSATIEALVRSSRALRDTRLLDSVSAVARALGSPQALRIAALRVLVGYFQGDLYADQVQLTQAASGGSTVLRSELHAMNELTSSPFLAATAAQNVGTLFRDLAASDPDPVIRAAARFLHQNAYYVHPEAVPIIPNTIDLLYVCGNKFRVRNAGDIAVQVTYTVGATESRMLPLPATLAAEPSSLVFTTRNQGTVRIDYNGQLVATRANGGTTCP